MGDKVYALVMLGVIVLVTAFAVPSLFRPKCGACNHRNKLDTTVCEKCGSQL